jgi:hypothetical protein
MDRDCAEVTLRKNRSGQADGAKLWRRKKEMIQTKRREKEKDNAEAQSSQRKRREKRGGEEPKSTVRSDCATRERFAEKRKMVEGSLDCAARRAEGRRERESRAASIGMTS